MNGYEKILKIIKNNTNTTTDSFSNFFLAEMTGPNSCVIDGLETSGDDLLISEHLTMKYIRDIELQNGEIVKKYIEPLKAGDSVITIQICGTKYAILERVV
jgi:hypothetical protein